MIVSNINYETITQRDVYMMSKSELQQLVLRNLDFINYQRSRKARIRKDINLSEVVSLYNQKTETGKRIWSMDNLAEKYGVTRQTISRWLNLYQSGVRTYVIQEKDKGVKKK